MLLRSAVEGTPTTRGASIQEISLIQRIPIDRLKPPQPGWCGADLLRCCSVPLI